MFKDGCLVDRKSIEHICNKWQLVRLKEIKNNSFTGNYVAVAHSEKYKTTVVVKILVKKTNELEALKFFNGKGCVKLLDSDLEHSAFLLEYVKPGVSLRTLFPENDFKAIEITTEVIKKLHVKNSINKGKGFKTVNQWLKLLSEFKSKQISEYLLQRARKLSKELLSKKQVLYVLHGDLHHENILSYEKEEWIVIDPKGVIGPLEYEIGRFIMNPIPELLLQSNVKEIIKNRIDRFSEIFGFEKQRIIDWCFVQAILGACWAEQDKNNTSLRYFIEFAEKMGD